MNQNIPKSELQLYKSFYDTYPDAILVLEEGVIVRYNLSAQKLFQINKEEDLLGKKLSSFTEKEFGKDIKIQDIFESYLYLSNVEGEGSFEWKIQNIKGEVVDTQIIFTKIETEQQSLIQVIIKDITEQRNIEQKYKILEDRGNSLKDAFDRSAIISFADKEGRITNANQEFCLISQYSEEELLGKDHNIVNSGYHSKEFWQEMWQTISRKKTWRADVKNKAKDGSFYWIDTVINPIIDNGKIMGYLSIRYLITSRKRIELELHIKQEQLQATEEELRQNLEELEAQRDYIQEVNREIKEKSDVSERNNTILLKLNKNQDIHAGNLDLAFESITKLVAENLDIERVGIWRYDEQNFKITSQKQYQKNENSYEFIQSEDINKEEAPIYFADIVSEQNIVADFAQNHPALVEFVDSYLIPLQINSMLDVPYFMDGKLAGVICCETQSQYKNWTFEDITFIKGIADIITIAIKTHQKIAEQEKVRQSEKLMLQFLNNLPMGITIFTKNREMFFVNNAAKNILGFDIMEQSATEQHSSKSIKTRIAGTQQEYPQEKLPHILALQGEKAYIDDLEIIKGDNTTLLEITGSPIWADNGDIEYSISVFQDISQRKAKEVELKKKNEELATTEEELRQNMEELQATQEAMREKQTIIEESKVALEKQNDKLQANEQILTKAFQKMKLQEKQLRDSLDAVQAQEEELRQNMEELQATQEILAYQKDILEISNRQITKSIAYAQTIQNAFLPSKRLIKHLLPESFVIYKPKDIVSGDFYWLSEHKNKMLIGAIDCTGHGVPGAFMSLVASSILNEIINQKEIFQPNIILQELHKGVVKKLNQKEGANNDGMDLTLCLLEKTATNETKLTFAGVKQNLYIVRNQELIELKGNRHSVGGGKRDEERSYTQEEVMLQKDDSVFLSTDGYADQANEERKSFSKKKFREVLLEIGHLSAQEQKKILENSLTQHQQQTDQRDDITVFGFKI